MSWLSRSASTQATCPGKTIASGIVRRTVAPNGKKAGAGTDLNSLATAAASGTGKNTTYSAANWDSANIRLISGTPNADTAGSPPDTWVIKKDNTVWYYPGGTTAQGTGRQIAAATDGRDWTDTKTIG